MKKILTTLFALATTVLLTVPVQAQSQFVTMGSLNVCDTLTTLKTKIDPFPRLFLVLGQTAAYDGGGGLFRWDATNTMSTNYSILASTQGPVIGGAGTGNWVLIPGTGYGKAPRTQTLVAATAVIAEYKVIKVVGTGGATTLTANPIISTTATGLTDGQEVEIIGTDDTNTVVFTDGSGQKLNLGASTRTVGSGDSLKLRYNAIDSFWYEIGFTNN